MLEIREKNTYKTGQILGICKGDITAAKVDAIVNAANERLAHGGGVAAVISRKGGPIIQEESDVWIRQHGPVPHEKPAYTSGGNLPSKYVIHTVGPVWGSGDEESKLTAAIEGSLELAHDLKLTSIAFPAISTGIFGFPVDLAAAIFMRTINSYFMENSGSTLQKVLLVLYSVESLNKFLNAFYNKFGEE